MAHVCHKCWRNTDRPFRKTQQDRELAHTYADIPSWYFSWQEKGVRHQATLDHARLEVPSHTPAVGPGKHDNIPTVVCSPRRLRGGVCLILFLVVAIVFF